MITKMTKNGQARADALADAATLRLVAEECDALTRLKLLAAATSLPPAHWPMPHCLDYLQHVTRSKVRAAFSAVPGLRG